MPNDAFRCGLGARFVNDQAYHQVGEVEAPVESVGERTEVAGGELAVLECLVSARQHRLDIAQKGVNPFELRQVSGFALTDDLDAVAAPASVTAAKHPRPSLRTSVPYASFDLAQFKIALLLKLATGEILT